MGLSDCVASSEKQLTEEEQEIIKMMEFLEVMDLLEQEEDFIENREDLIKEVESMEENHEVQIKK